jgi:hypothetical protein
LSGSPVAASGAVPGSTTGRCWRSQFRVETLCATTTAIYADAVGEEEQSIAARMW